MNLEVRGQSLVSLFGRLHHVSFSLDHLQLMMYEVCQPCLRCFSKLSISVFHSSSIAKRGFATTQPWPIRKVCRLGLVNPSRETSDQFFNVLQFAQDNLRQDPALQLRVKRVLPHRDRLMDHFLGQLLVADTVRQRLFRNCIYIASESFSCRSFVPRRELAADNNQNELEVQTSGTRTFEHIKNTAHGLSVRSEDCIHRSCLGGRWTAVARGGRQAEMWLHVQFLDDPIAAHVSAINSDTRLSLD